MMARITLALALASAAAGQSPKQTEKPTSPSNGLPELLRSLEFFRQDVTFDLHIKTARIKRGNTKLLEPFLKAMAPRPDFGPPPRATLVTATSRIPAELWRDLGRMTIQQIGDRVVQRSHAAGLKGGRNGVATTGDGTYTCYDADNDTAYLTQGERAQL